MCGSLLVNLRGLSDHSPNVPINGTPRNSQKIPCNNATPWNTYRQTETSIIFSSTLSNNGEAEKSMSTFFRSLSMSMQDAKLLFLFHGTLAKLDLTTDKSLAIVTGIYIATETSWQHMKLETDYDDYH
jgi:hypothetical protein